MSQRAYVVTDSWAAGGGPRLMAFDGLLPGDVLDSIKLNVKSGPSANGVNDAAVNVAVYACNSKPASVGEAEAGSLLFTTGGNPIPANVIIQDATTSIFHLVESVPTAFRPGEQERYIAVVLTPEWEQDDITYAALYLDVFRPDRREDDDSRSGGRGRAGDGLRSTP